MKTREQKYMEIIDTFCEEEDFNLPLSLVQPSPLAIVSATTTSETDYMEDGDGNGSSDRSGA